MFFTLQPNGQIICPLAGERGQVQQAWREARAKGALLRMPIPCTNMFAGPSCLIRPSEVSTRSCPCVRLHPVSVQPQLLFPIDKADVLLPRLQTIGPSTLCTER